MLNFAADNRLNNKQMRMKKALLIIALASIALCCKPTSASAFSFYLQEAPETPEMLWTVPDEREQPEGNQPVITPVDGQNAVNVTGAQGQTLEVVSLTGRRVETIRIESVAQRVELNLPKGCYILKIGKTARKVSVK